MTRFALFAGLAVLTAVSSLAAQSQVTLPGHAATSEGHHAHWLPFGTEQFRTQLLIDASAISSNGGLLQSLRFRADRSMLPQAASSLPNVTVSLSHSTVPIAGMSTTFAANFTETPVVVFQGTVQLPATLPGSASLPAWNVEVLFQQPFWYWTTQGNLLVEIVANSPFGGGNVFWLDANEPGGAATSFGIAGDSPTFDTISLQVGTGPMLQPQLLTIGQTISFTTIRQFTPAPGVLALGTAPQTPAIDLGPIGAPTNTLYIDPISLNALPAWTPGLFGLESTVDLVVPAQPALVGIRLLGQSAVLDATANALGLLLSGAVDVRIGDANEVMAVRQLDGGQATSTSGFLLDFGGTSPSYGAVAMQLVGAFF